MKIPVIIDCDPGTDDTIALIMALASEALDVKAITTVAGNQTAEKTAVNGLKIVSFLDKQLPVARGAEKPIMRPLVTAGHVHGETGMAHVVLPEAKNDYLETKAWDLFYKMSVESNEKIHLITLGPLSNVAIALMKYPHLKDGISQITMMGGAVGYGNDTQAAEYNIYADPEAAKMVFESGIPITMVGLDCTHQAWITQNEIESMGKPSKENGVWLAQELMRHIHEFASRFGFEGAIMHDPSAIAAVIDPTLIQTEDYFVTVETKGEHTLGKTVVDTLRVTGHEPNAQVALDMDRERFVELVKGLIQQYEI
ncbi:MAG: nucleoside hydrolase [Tindallia sp. MSAO_Bac2]|nr:MAG: nucleoside hydrolase [Tindallia sp. MSAO_Bac2]